MVNFFIFIRSVVKQACDTFSEYSLPLQAAKLQSILPKSNLWVALFCFFFFLFCFGVFYWCVYLNFYYEFCCCMGKNSFFPEPWRANRTKVGNFICLPGNMFFFLICIWVSLVSRSWNFLIPGTKLLRNEINSSGLICN